MVAREAVAARFGAVVESNLDMVCAILSRSVEVRVALAVGLVHRAQDIAVTVEEVQDESAIRLRLFFPENVPVHLDTLELADLRSSVEGFDTHLIDVRIDGEARTVTYDMLRTDVDCQIARGRGVFHSAGHVFSCGDPTGTRNARDTREARDVRNIRNVRDFVGTDEMRRLTSLLSKEQVDCVLEVRTCVGVLRSDCNSAGKKQAIRTFTGACDVLEAFDVSVRESKGQLCEVVLEGVGAVDARTCLALTRHPTLGCNRVRFVDKKLR